MFDKNSCIPGVYLPRGERGSGLMELNKVHRTTTVGLAEYVKISTDYPIQFVCNHEDSKLEKVSLTHLVKISKTGVCRRCHT